jgi:hypothetical protein
MKPYWFKLTEHDEPISIKPKNNRFLILLIGIAIGFMGSYLPIPSKVADYTVVKPKVHKPNPIPINIIKKPSISTLPNEDQDDGEDD